MDNFEKIQITDAVLMAYLAEELNPIKRQVVSAWIKDSAENTSHFNQIKTTWEYSAKLQPRPVLVDTNKAWKNVLNKITKKETKVIAIKKKSNRKALLSVAGMIIILIGVFSVLKFTQNIEIEMTNHVAEHAGVTDRLSDGSIVVLNANTSLIYPEEFNNDERRVALKGEAFFDIERNEEKPFIIDLPSAAYVKVLGTAFNIKAFEHDTLVEVFVSQGKVEFGQGKDKIILKAGEKGVLNTKSRHIYKEEKSTTGIPELYWKEEVLRFDNVPLDEAIDVLNLLFDDEVHLACENARDLAIVSNHPKIETLEEILSVIAVLHELSISQKTQNGQTEFTLNCND